MSPDESATSAHAGQSRINKVNVLSEPDRKQGLYRSEALLAQQTKWLSDTLIIRPRYFDTITSIFALIGLGFLSLVIFGKYTQHATVSGQLVPESGVQKVYADQPGVIADRYVQEGQFVLKGRPLLRISSDKRSDDQADIQSKISSLARDRRELLHQEEVQTASLQDRKRDALRTRIAILGKELDSDTRAIALQTQRVSIAEGTTATYKSLSEQGVVARLQYEEKAADELDQRNRLTTMEHDRSSTSAQLEQAKADYGSNPIEDKNALSAIRRQETELSTELLESEEKRSAIIPAPADGFITAITVTVGQHADVSQMLMSIVPRSAKLQAYLYAPASAIGMVEPGNRVILRYQGYPYQKFGSYSGVVLAISRTALSASEVGDGIAAAASAPLYRVTVQLKSQTVSQYGKEYTLPAGMVVDADILQEPRRVYEWLLDPVLSMSKRLRPND